MASIRSIPGWREMSGAEILEYLFEFVTVASGRGRLTHSWVAENIGLAAADLVYAEINKVSPPTALRFAAGNGIDTSAALWKQQAEAVADAIPSLAPHLVTLRDFETVHIPRWQAEGYETEPTLQSVTAEIEAEQLATAARERLATIQLCRQAFDRVTAEIRQQIEAGVVNPAQIADSFSIAWVTAWQR